MKRSDGSLEKLIGVGIAIAGAVWLFRKVCAACKKGSETIPADQLSRPTVLDVHLRPPESPRAYGWRWQHIAAILSFTCALVVASVSIYQARLSVQQVEVAVAMAKQQAFSTVRIQIEPIKPEVMRLNFINFGQQRIHNVRIAMAVVHLPSQEKPQFLPDNPHFWPLGEMDPNTMLSRFLQAPLKHDPNLFAVAVFSGTQTFLNETRSVKKTAVALRFGTDDFWQPLSEDLGTLGSKDQEALLEQITLLEQENSKQELRKR